MNWNSLLFSDFICLENPRISPDYDDEARALIQIKVPEFTKAHTFPALRVERALLVKWDEWKIGQVLGTRIEHHMIRYLCHLIPSLVPDPWFQERVWSFYDTRANRRKVTNWWGCQNSGKTNTMASMAIGFGCLHPHLTRQTASGPFKDAGESPLWSAMQEIFEEVRMEWGDKLAEWTGATWDNRKKLWLSDEDLTACIMKATNSKGTLTFSEAPKAGTLKLVAMDEIGKVQGAKAKDRHQKDGYFLMWLDEIGAGYPTMNILKALHNLRSNKNLHVVTACNPFNPVGQLDGELGRPSNGYESLRIDQDYVWNSENGSRTYRFDGHLSPNIVLGEDRWPWLFNEERKDQLLSSTAQDSDFYNSQCRAFMNIGSGNRYVLTTPDIKEGMVDQEFEWTADDKWKVAFLDPALSTDGDNAIYTVLEGGYRREVGGTLSPVVYCPKQVVLPIYTGKTADLDWTRKCEVVRGKNSSDNHKEGHLIPVEEQLAVLAGYQLLLDRVPFRAFAYDDSMRSKIMEAMIWAMGEGPKAISSVGDPEDVPMYPPRWVDVSVATGSTKRRLVTWKEDCQKFVSQQWFFGAAVVRSGVFRCERSVMVALSQATRRFWGYAAGGKKRVVESKKEYKVRGEKISPDHADSLFGAIYNANRLGLLKLKIDMPDAQQHLRPASRPTTILTQWKKRRLNPSKLGLSTTGTR